MPGTGEMLIIALLAIIVVDPKKLPDLMKSLGKAIGEFKQMSGEFKRTIERETEMADFEKRKAEAHEQLYGTGADAAKVEETPEEVVAAAEKSRDAKPADAKPEDENSKDGDKPEAEAEAAAAPETPAEQGDFPQQPPVERAETPADEVVETPADERVEAPVEASAEATEEVPAEAPVGTPVDVHAGEPAAAPASEVAEAPVDERAEAPADVSENVPAQPGEVAVASGAEPVDAPADEITPSGEVAVAAAAAVAVAGTGGEDVPPPPPPAGDDAVGEGHSGRMSLFGHLQDLRKRLTRCVIAVLVGFLVSYAFAGKLLKILMQPMLDAIKQSHFIYTLPTEAFFTEMKIAFVAGIFLCSPYIFYQIWQFIAPGLYSHERKWIIPIAFFSALCFSVGAFFGYFVVFPFGFEFFASYTNEYLVFTPKLDEYLDFVLKLLFAFGLVFELPLFLFFLARLGIVTHEGLKAKRKYAILVAFVVAAALTPPDAISQTMMAVPLCVLYELGVWLAFFFGKKKKPAPQEEAPAPTETA